MKRTNALGIAVMLLALLSFASCNKEKEMTKMISADRVELTGDNSNLFEIDADSVKVMLIPIGTTGEKWEVRTIIPLRNTTPWSEIPGSDQSLSSFIYGVSMYVHYLDSYDSELDLSIQNDNEIAKKLLKSEELITEDMPITESNYGNKSYKYQKAYFDKIDGLKVQIELSWAHSGNSSSSSSYSSSTKNTNWNQLLDEYEKCVNECVKLLKKDDNGEWVSADKLEKLLDKAEELEEKLDDGIYDMSDAQYKRYMRIGDKLDAAL